jgi:hypothetical protein
MFLVHKKRPVTSTGLSSSLKWMHSPVIRMQKAGDGASPASLSIASLHQILEALRRGRMTISDEDLMLSSEQHFIVYLRGAQPSYEVLK